MLEKIKGRRTRGCQRMRFLDGVTDAMNVNLGKLREVVRDKKAWHAVAHGVATEQSQHDLKVCLFYFQGSPILVLILKNFKFLKKLNS